MIITTRKMKSESKQFSNIESELASSLHHLGTHGTGSSTLRISNSSSSKSSVQNGARSLLSSSAD